MSLFVCFSFCFLNFFFEEKDQIYKVTHFVLVVVVSGPVIVPTVIRPAGPGDGSFSRSLFHLLCCAY